MSIDAQDDLAKIRRPRDGSTEESDDAPEIFTCPIEGCSRTMIDDPGALRNHVIQFLAEAEEDPEGRQLIGEGDLIDVSFVPAMDLVFVDPFAGHLAHVVEVGLLAAFEEALEVVLVIAIRRCRDLCLSIVEIEVDGFFRCEGFRHGWIGIAPGRGD